MKNICSKLLRRDFITAATGVTWASATLRSPKCLSAAESIEERVAKVMHRTIGIDMHNHVYPAGPEQHPQGGQSRPQGQPAPELFLSSELKRSGLTAVCASFVLDFAPNHKPGDARDNLLRWLTAIDTQLESGRIRRALNLTDLQEAHDNERPTIADSGRVTLY